MKLRYVCKGFFLFACAFALGTLVLSQRGSRRFSQIKPGATKPEVIRLMGTPTGCFSNILVPPQFGGYEAWAYRSDSLLSEIIHGDFMTMGLPNTNDYVVVFGFSDRVSKTFPPGAKW